MSDRNLNDEIFDLILAQALKADCEREIAMFERMANESEPPEFSEKYKKGISGIKKKLRRKENTAKFKKAAPKFATAAAAVIVVAALATNPVVAETARNIIMWITGDTARHEFKGSETVTPETFNQRLRPDFLPEGYRIQSEWYGTPRVAVDYVNNDWDMIIFEYGIADGAMFGIDIENAVQHTASVNGREAFFYEATDEDLFNCLVWENRGYAFVIYAQIERDVFVQIAESIIFR